MRYEMSNTVPIDKILLPPLAFPLTPTLVTRIPQTSLLCHEGLRNCKQPTGAGNTGERAGRVRRQPAAQRR